MSHINLLPWRDELRVVRNRIFYAIIMGIVFLCGIMVVFTNLFIVHSITRENTDIAYLQTEKDKIKDKIKEIEGLRANKKQLLYRKEIIQALQEDRPSIVKLLDIIARITPEGLYLTELNRKEILPEEIPAPTPIAKEEKAETQIIRPKQYLVEMQGIAQTNSAISFLLKKLEEQNWFSDVRLTEVVRGEKDQTLLFKLEFVQDTPDKGS